MHCNQKGYDMLIKYIPYDNVEIVENQNSFKHWNYYKVDIIKQMTEDFIHVDSDVFIFGGLFSEYIANPKYDVIVQDTLAKNQNIANDYVTTFNDYLLKNNIFDPNIYDGKCFSCGTIGMRIELKDGYTGMCDAIKSGIEMQSSYNPYYIGMVCEELAMYLYAQKHGLKTYEVLPFELVQEKGPFETGNIVKYTHMWFQTKFDSKYVKLIRNKILKDFPEHRGSVEKYEKEIISKTNILKEIS
jgi:hypothetical protein